MQITPQLFAEQLSKQLLKIECPQIKADASVLRGTSIAALINGTLFYNPSINELDVFFSLAHELRHVWQKRNHNSVYFNSYKTADELSIEEYNNQLAELDANAFATLMMEVTFGVKARFAGLSEKTKSKIFELSKQLNAEYLLHGYFK